MKKPITTLLLLSHLCLLTGCGAGGVNLVAKGQLAVDFGQVAEPGLQTKQEIPDLPASKATLPKPKLTILPFTQVQGGKLLVPALLKLTQGDEFQLQGELRLNNGQTISLDRIHIENPNPTLVETNGDKRLIKGLKAGKTVLKVSSPDFPHIHAEVKVEIEASNLVMLQLEIE